MKKLLEKVDMINTILGLLSCPVSKSIYEHIIANDMFIYEKYVYLPIILGIWAVVVHFIVRLVDIVVNALMRHVTVEKRERYYEPIFLLKLMYYVLAISLVLLADCKFIFAAIALYSAGLRVVGICLGLTFVIITMLFAFIEFEWIFKDISSVEFYRAHVVPVVVMVVMLICIYNVIAMHWNSYMHN